MKKNINESELKNIVSECVKKVLGEGIDFHNDGAAFYQWGDKDREEDFKQRSNDSYNKLPASKQKQFSPGQPAGKNSWVSQDGKNDVTKACKSILKGVKEAMDRYGDDTVYKVWEILRDKYSMDSIQSGQDIVNRLYMMTKMETGKPEYDDDNNA